jgi:hypothetical protein
MTVSKNLATDLGTTGGEWLFRQGEIILGPVPANQVVEQLYAGTLTGSTEISLLEGGHFMRLSEVDFFKLHLAKAEAKLRVDAAAQVERAKARGRRKVRIAIVVAVSLPFAGATAFVTRYFFIHNPWKNADLPAFTDISIEPPVIRLAQRTSKDELVEYPGKTFGRLQRRANERGAEKTRLASGKTDKPSRVQDEEPDGLTTGQFDRDSISAVVSAKQKTLYPCVAEEVKRRPGFSAKIPIEFVIGNDGRVTKVWVDHPSLRESGLPDCLLRELQRWPFRAYPGEQATVALSFKVGKGG